MGFPDSAALHPGHAVALTSVARTKAGGRNPGSRNTGGIATGTAGVA